MDKLNKNSPLFAYAVKHKSDVRMKSSSGGMFTALSDYILDNNGKVYGADFDDNMKLRHTAASTNEARDRMRGAKYIQSDISNVLNDIKTDLKNNLPVLFVGTPCQVSAVKKNISENENLYTVDLICHGAPAPEVWEKFIAYVQKKYSKKAIYFSFRNKDIAWRKYSGRVIFEDGSTAENTSLLNAYTELFSYDLLMRDACEKCPFADIFRVGDVTIGDFWGIENVLPQIDDNKGVSAVLVNTEKGEKLFNLAKNDLEIYEVKPEQIAARQPNLSKPSKKSIKAEAFKNDFENLPFDKVLKKYTRVGLKRKIISFIKGVLGK